MSERQGNPLERILAITEATHSGQERAYTALSQIAGIALEALREATPKRRRWRCVESCFPYFTVGRIYNEPPDQAGPFPGLLMPFLLDNEGRRVLPNASRFEPVADDEHKEVPGE